MEITGFDKANTYFAEKAKGSTKTIEEIFGVFAAVTEEVGNVDGIDLPPDSKVSTLLKSRTIQKNGDVYYSLRDGRTITYWYIEVAKTTMPAAIQVKIAQILDAKTSALYGGWLAPTNSEHWQSLYAKLLKEYEAYVVALCEKDPVALKLLLTLYAKDAAKGP